MSMIYHIDEIPNSFEWIFKKPKTLDLESPRSTRCVRNGILLRLNGMIRCHIQVTARLQIAAHMVYTSADNKKQEMEDGGTGRDDQLEVSD